MAAGLIAILYRYWLVTPVLQYLNINQWRVFAIGAAALCGAVLALLRFPTLALTCGPMAGLLIGGTWAAWQAPHDVPLSVTAAFASHLESFWQEVIALTVTATAGGLCCARFARHRSPR